VRAEHGTPVTLPADYVARHVQLGYAVTAHRAQGTTVDTTHVVAAAGMTREAFYVAMTRGRYANHAHVITDQDPDADQPATEQTAGVQAVLEQILANTGHQFSAHDTQARLEHQAQQWISRREADTGAGVAERDSRSGPAHFARQPAPRPSEHPARQFSGYSRRDTRQQPPSRGVTR
jgi:ATP-dependent exoDNAse (exonuclease V) alpha subunit